LRVIALVDWAPLADVLDDDESGLAAAFAIDEYLVGSACVDTFTPLGNGLVFISGRALSTFAVDAILSVDAITIESVSVEYLIFPAAIAMLVRTGCNLGGGFTVFAILRIGCYCK
jgi:hypothetical protein